MLVMLLIIFIAWRPALLRKREFCNQSPRLTTAAFGGRQHSTQGVHCVRPPTSECCRGSLGCALPINFERKSLSQYPRTPNARPSSAVILGHSACKPLRFGFGLQSGGPSRMALSQRSCHAHTLPDTCYDYFSLACK